jgi:hypothetical protein
MMTMRKLLVVCPLLLVLAGGCDATRRDFTYCDTTYSQCAKGFTCNLATGLCVVDVDGGLADTFVPDTSTTTDLSPPVEVSPPDVADAPLVDVTPVDSTQRVDASIIDVPPPVDVSIPDTRVPDAAGTCSVDNDCVGVSAGAYCLNTKCVACKTSNQCNNDAGVPFCSAQNTCVSCARASNPDGGSACSGTTPVCNATSGGCVECVKNSECPTASKGFCVKNQCKGCESVATTSTDAGVPDGGSTSTGACTGATPVCVPSTDSNTAIAGRCVGCATSADCSNPVAPICNITTTSTVPAYTCTACTSDKQCSDKGVGPGVCMFHLDGRCATDAETIYVKNSTGCSGGAGTSALPCCQPQAGVNAVTTGKRVVVMMGTGSLGVWVGSFSGSQVSIFGQNSATISPGGADIGIRIASGSAYVRGLTIQGVGANATSPGIVVEAGATLGLDRCIVKANAGGLLVKPGANFDVANSVFDSNQQGLFGTTTRFGGIYLGGSAPTSGLRRFWFNTVVNNQDVGVVCSETTQALTGMLLFGNVNGDFLSCALDITSKWRSGTPTPDGASSDTRDPLLTSTDHLTSGSWCKDYVNATVGHPLDDMDGELRPKGTKLDCGADEY